MVKAVIVRCKQPTRRGRRQLRPLRQQCGRDHRQRTEPPRHAHFRRRRPRTAGAKLHENREPRQPRWCDVDSNERYRERDCRRGPRHHGQGAPRDRKAGKVVVEGVNRVYKHVRRSQRNPQGGRLSKEMPIAVSNVLLVCRALRPAARMGARYLPDGAKERYCKKCGAGNGLVAPPKRTATPSNKSDRAMTASESAERRPSKKSAAAAPEADRPTPRLLERVSEGDPAGAGRKARAAATASRCRGCRRSSSTWAWARRSPKRNTWRRPSSPEDKSPARSR